MFEGTPKAYEILRIPWQSDFAPDRLMAATFRRMSTIGAIACTARAWFCSPCCCFAHVPAAGLSTEALNRATLRAGRRRRRGLPLLIGQSTPPAPEVAFSQQLLPKMDHMMPGMDSTATVRCSFN